MGTAALVGLALAAGWWLSMDGYTGPVSEHFDGTKFHNREATSTPNARSALRMAMEYERVPWDDWRENPPATTPAERVTEGVVATFVNHATVLLQFDGLNVLTDPIWSERCSAVQWAGPARHHAPGIALADLPPIDVVVISHNHYDHLDVNTLSQLAALGDPLVLTGLGTGDFISALGLRTQELDWGDETTVGGVRFIGQRTRHFSSRGLFDRMETLWLGFVMQGPSTKIYFAGDTGMGSHFAETGAEHGPFDLSLIPIGAYSPRWFMSPIHIDPAQAVLAHQQLRSRSSLGIHHGTFQLTEEGMDDPVKLLASEASAAGLKEGEFRALKPGEAWRVAPEARE